MAFIRSFSLNADRTNPFPFNIPAVKFAQKISLYNSITILVGDNGCGKSTLLESLALHLNLPLIGGFIREKDGFEAARILQSCLEIDWKKQIKKGFFFRAEDFSDFINSVEREKDKIDRDLQELRGQVNDSVIREMTESMNFTLKFMRRDYGDNMQAYSHGEAYLKILQTRISGKGIFLLDEPEAALSPLKQLSLISFIMEVVSRQESQFIIATHSPIIMGLPGASLYQIQNDGIESVGYKETEHYSITKNFLDNPSQFLRYL